MKCSIRIFIVFLMALLMLQSCSNVGDDLKAKKERSLDYFAFDSNEKVSFWLKHFEHESKTVFLTENQRTKLDDFIKKHLKVELFESEKIRYDPVFLADVRELILSFSEADFALLFMNINGEHKNLNKSVFCTSCLDEIELLIKNGPSSISRGPSDPPYPGYPGTDNCKCSWGLCVPGDCKRIKCQTTRYGCGVLFLFECHDQCVI
jgi:hypothetical protein